jgi:ankyrin repeat protein
VKKLRFNGREWALMAALFVSFSFLFVPYRVWEHLDMTVCSSGPLGDAFLLEAARLGDLGQVTRLVAEGHSVNRDSGSDDTPLSSAIKGRKADVVAFLLSKGANVNAHNSLTGETPLMKAAYSEDTQMLELLIAQGADPCAINNKWDQENAQRIAEKKHNPVAAEYLTAHSHCSLPPRLPASCANESAATCVEVH